MLSFITTLNASKAKPGAKNRGRGAKKSEMPLEATLTDIVASEIKSNSQWSHLILTQSLALTMLVIQFVHLPPSQNRTGYCMEGGRPVGHCGSAQVSLEILSGSCSRWVGKTLSDRFPLGLRRQYAANTVSRSLCWRWLFNYWARLRGKDAWQKPWHKPFIVRLHHGPNAKPAWTVHLKEKLITHGFRHTITDYDWLVAPRWIQG